MSQQRLSKLQRLFKETGPEIRSLFRSLDLQSGLTLLANTVYLPNELPKVLPFMITNEINPPLVRKSDVTIPPEKIFMYVKDSVRLRIKVPCGPYEALRTGNGVCLDKSLLFGTICQANGFKVRYVYSPVVLGDQMYSMIELSGGFIEKWYRLTEHFIGHMYVEVYIDGKWVAGDPALHSAFEAGIGLPITRLGENPTAYEYREKIYFHRVPWWVWLMGTSLVLTHDTARKVNIKIRKDEEKGGKILEDMGVEAYDREARRRYEYMGPTIDF